MTGAKNRKGEALPTLYLPEEVATSLRCSTWWVKEQARKGRIPFIRSGGGYRFTENHVAEILDLLEQRPAPRRESSSVTNAERKYRSRGNNSPESPVRLRARPPRRAKSNEQS